MSEPDPALRRLRWRCRRGMKEIDAMLTGYLDQAGESLPVASMERLLDCQDDQMWQWLLGRSAPEDPELASLVRDIRRLASPQ